MATGVDITSTTPFPAFTDKKDLINALVEESNVMNRTSLLEVIYRIANTDLSGIGSPTATMADANGERD